MIQISYYIREIKQLKIVLTFDKSEKNSFFGIRSSLFYESTIVEYLVHLFQTAKNESDGSSGISRYLGLGIRNRWENIASEAENRFN